METKKFSRCFNMERNRNLNITTFCQGCSYKSKEKTKTENLLPKLLAQKNIEVLNSKTYVTLFLSKFFNLCMGKPPSLILLLCVQPFGSKGKGYLLDQRGRSSLAKGAGDP